MSLQKPVMRLKTESLFIIQNLLLCLNFYIQKRPRHTRNSACIESTDL